MTDAPLAPLEEAKAEPRFASARFGLRAALQSDLYFSFIDSKVTVIASLVVALFFITALFAPWLAPYDPFDPATLDLMDARTPPLSEGFTGNYYLFGTDDQGRDMLSSVMYGARISLAVGLLSVALAMLIGLPLGLLSGYFGGAIDVVVMRVADVQISFPAILIALLTDGVARTVIPHDLHSEIGIYVLVVAIGVSQWVPFARTVRASTMVERRREYVQAAQITGIPSVIIMLRHILPNVLTPVLVIATISAALAIITEATLSYLGVGVPPTRPSLGTLIRIGNEYLFSGEWWITLFPGAALVLLSLSINLLGDWLRDALNPRLR